MNRHDIAKIIAHFYFWITLIGLGLFFHMDILWDMIFLLGCHTTVYPIFGMVLAADHGLLLLRNVIFVFWIFYVVSFIASYLAAWLRKRYFPLAFIALIDAVFSFMIVCWAVASVGFGPEKIMMLIGILFSFLTFSGLLWPIKHH